MEETVDFEKSFTRLEAILEKMNSGKATLDESLHLYEEADGLIMGCAKKLGAAEKKIEMLIKRRGGELEVDKEGKPMTQAFELQER